MIKTILVILVMMMALTLVIGSSGIVTAKENIEKDNDAYVKILGIPVSGDIEFDYGWNESKQFASPAVGYWLGLYDVTNSHYEWASEQQFPVPGPGTIVWDSLKLSYKDTTPLEFGQYAINFFVRGSYESPVTNVAEITVYFSTQSITVALPRESSRWAVGSSQTITWTSVGVSGNVDIQLSRDNGANWTTIIPATTNDGSEDWIVTGPGTKDAKIRVVSVDTPTVSGNSAKFTIAQSMTVTSPRESSRWAVGSNQTITWTSVGVTGNVDITLSRNGGASWEPIVSNAANDGTEIWTVTGPATRNAIIKVVSVDFSTVSNTSSKFTIR